MKRYLFVAAIVVVGAFAFFLYRALRPGPFESGTPISATSAIDGRIAFIGNDFVLHPLSQGWILKTFWNVKPTDYSIETIDGRRALHCQTANSASILARSSMLSIADFPLLSWEWKIEKPLASDKDEATPAGDDHPARIFLLFESSDGERKSAEIIWSNTRFQPGDYIVIDGYHHLVANGLDENVGVWHQQEVDLRQLYSTLSDHLNGAKLTALGFFCDSDNTGGSTSAYFYNVALQRAGATANEK